MLREMASEGTFSISVESVVEDVLKQHGTGLSDMDLASRKQEEAAIRRHEAAGWLRKMVGVVGAKDLPEEPSEEEFRLGLRNGIILCNALNKVQPGTVPKVVEAPADPALLPDGAALSAYQYFENVRNFLVSLEELGLPTFEASDLGQGGKGSRVVNCILALKSYSESKQIGKNGSWKYGGILRPTSSGKHFIRKNSEPFVNSLSRSQSVDKIQDGVSVEQNLSFDLSIESNEMTTSDSLNMLIRTILADKKPEEVPVLVGSMLSKVMQEFERRIASQNELVNTTLKDIADGKQSYNKANDLSNLSSLSDEKKMEKEENKNADFTNEETIVCYNNEETTKERLQKQGLIFDRQERKIQELKDALHITRASVDLMKTQYYEEFNNLGKHLHILAHAASGYHKVLEENRKLYNQVQDLKGNIRVYCRVRPFLSGQSSSSSTVAHTDDGSITIMTPAKYGKEGRKSFNFNKVFGPSATQEEVFLDTQPLIRSVLDGYNVCIFAYGQTGAGKTHTMTGPKELNEHSIGVNYRALNDLFHLSEERKGTFCYQISVQMIEIYNEQVRDLLTKDGLHKRLEIRTSSQKGLTVPDASLVPVTSPSEVIELMNLGHRNRAASATAMNDRSSRSHSCLTIHVHGRDLTSGTTLRGCMHLVDLAGSERVDKSEARGERLKEAQHINKSLSALGDVISALAQKSSHVPYRNSKLTQLLQDSLGGQAKTLMFVHISPEVDAIGETIGTLKFAERVATIELGAARLNKENSEVKELKEQIGSLKAALARKDEEPEHFRTAMSSPDLYQMKSSGVSPAHLNHRQSMEDVGNIEIHGISQLMQKRANIDLHELIMDTESSPWADTSLRFQKTNNKEVGSEGWVDKIMFNKTETFFGDQDSMSDWDGDSLHEPDFLYQDCMPDMSSYQDQQRSRANSVATDDSDDNEMTNSDSSEQDIPWQLNVRKLPDTTNGISMTKKPQSNPTKSPNPRIVSHPPIPSPSRKISHGSNQTPTRTSRQHLQTNGGKRSNSGKVASRK